MLKRFLKKHPKFSLSLLVFFAISTFLVLCTSMGRFVFYLVISLISSVMPSLFLWGDKVDITFNLPENVHLESISAGYHSKICQVYGIGQGDWLYSKKDLNVKEKQIGTNQYQVSVYFKDNFICQWQLEDIYWRLQYKDLNKIYPQVSQQNGGRGSEFDGRGAYFKYIKSNDEEILDKNKGTIKVNIHDIYIPEIELPYEVEYWMTPIQGNLLYFSKKNKIFDGQFGLDTRHINYTATIEQPPFEQIPRTK